MAIWPTIDPSIPPDVVERVAEILDAEELSRALPAAPQHRLRVEAVLERGATLAEAHGVWQAEFLATLPGLTSFAHQAADAKTPEGIVRVSCECVQGPSGGMSSYHGFLGYYVSLLVSLSDGRVWDARVEPAR